MTSKEIIEKIYETFAKYKLIGKIDKCPCGCISEEDEQKIYSKPLKELTIDDLGFYSNKAMTTWGNEENYKHFLPRIIEIYNKNKSNGWIDLDSIRNKLSHANWENWIEDERKSILKFIKFEWTEMVNKKEHEFWISDFEPYLYFFELEKLFEIWDFPDNKIALRNFVEFFYMNGNEIFYSSKKLKLNGVDRKNQFLNLSKRENLRIKLEEEFFANENLEKEYSDKISTVLQMIEN